jgi:micrococcal nuclease
MALEWEWKVPAVVRRVVDGDTIELDLDLGWRVYRNLEHLRILGINAPEKNTKAGKAAKAFAEALLPAGLQVVVTSQAKPTFTRTVGAIEIPGKGDFAALMVAAGHATPFLP